MSSLHYAEEDRKADADTHLAAARSQNTGTGILGIVQKIKDSRTAAVFFVIYDSGEGKQFLKLCLENCTKVSKCSAEGDRYGRNRPLCAVHGAGRAFVGVRADELLGLPEH